MSCEALEDQVLMLAAGETGPDVQGLLAHLAAGCPGCEVRLAETRAMLSVLPLAMDRVEPPASAWTRLSARVDADIATTAPAGRIAPEPRRRSVWPAILAAAAAVAITAGVMWVPLQQERAQRGVVTARLESQRSDLLSAQNSAAALDAQLRASEKTVSMLRSQQLVQVELKGTAESPAAIGRLLIDLKQGEWRFVGGSLPPTLAGKVYELWFITPDQKPIAMGSFTVNERGEGSLGNVVPPVLPALALAAVSLEPGPGATVPTGKVFMAGSFK